MKYDEKDFKRILCLLPKEEYKKFTKKMNESGEYFKSRLVRKLVEKFNRGEIEL